MAAFRGSVQLSGRNMSSGCFRSLECSFPRKPCTSLTTTTTRLGKPNCLGFQSSEHSFSWSFAKRRRCLSVRVSRNRGPQSERKPKRDEGKPWDPVLVAGDLLMLIATDLASERIPLRDQGFLGFVVCTVWLLVWPLAAPLRAPSPLSPPVPRPPSLPSRHVATGSHRPRRLQPQRPRRRAALRVVPLRPHDGLHAVGPLHLGAVRAGRGGARLLHGVPRAV
mmetsp:Transcript_7583/g.18208  ORF Transcript_7583/g.18208 Transcript_7583/m.18208 type:complete len:222 (+) Transcript_7583:110-775(+)